MENKVYGDFFTQTSEVKTQEEISNSQNDSRQSGIELLRIISMLLIVLHHASLYGGGSIVFENYFVQLIIHALAFGGKIGVNIFVLISAYFMINKNFKLSRILKLYLEVIFYSLFLFILFIIFHADVEISVSSVLSIIFPFSYSQWWFVTCFMYLMLLSPALNIIIKKIPQKKLKWGIIIIIASIVIFEGMNFFINGNFRQLPYFSELIWFIILYFIASYIRLYNVSISRLIAGIFIPIFFVATILFSFIISRNITDCESIINIVLSILMFLFFKDLKFKSKFINTIASTTLGIYLIHEFPLFRSLVWPKIIRFVQLLVKNSILTVFVSTIFVFIACALIDLIRQQTIHRLTKKFLKKLDEKLIR